MTQFSYILEARHITLFKHYGGDGKCCRCKQPLMKDDEVVWNVSACGRKKHYHKVCWERMLIEC